MTSHTHHSALCIQFLSWCHGTLQIRLYVVLRCVCIADQTISPWSSNSASSCQSSVEIKEFFYDDDLIDTADWTLGRHVSLHDDTSSSSIPTHSSTSAVIDSSAVPGPGQAGLTVKPNDSPADKTLTAGR